MTSCGHNQAATASWLIDLAVSWFVTFTRVAGTVRCLVFIGAIKTQTLVHRGRAYTAGSVKVDIYWLL